MKTNYYLHTFGKWLMKINAIKIYIFDDEEAYFHEKMIKTAHDFGYKGIERHFLIDHEKLNYINQTKPNILILDVKNVCAQDVAKDGIAIAKTFQREHDIMLVMTSAHQYHLNQDLQNIDYFIEQRQLTTVQFIDELHNIIDLYITKKSKFYKNILFKIGLKIIKTAKA